jgi:5-methylcytosine-specific restriction protein A
MGKLSQLKPILRSLPSSLGYAPQGEKEYDRFRGNQAWRKWYNTRRWQKLRWTALVRDAFTCQMCGRLEGDTSQLVADHWMPHKGDEALFWDFDNLKTLCKSPCHDKHKQRIERQATGGW